MSYSVWVGDKNASVTLNCNRILVKSMGMVPSDLDGMITDEVIAAVKGAIEKIENNPLEYKDLELGKGHGSCETALNFLRDLLEGCKEYPECQIEVNY